MFLATFLAAPYLLAQDQVVRRPSREPALDAGLAVAGAIRWDAWFDTYLEDPPPQQIAWFEGNLQWPGWSFRWPYVPTPTGDYTQWRPDGSFQILADDQNVMVEEIRLARAAGLDYFAFGYYTPGWSWADRLNYGWRRFAACSDAQRGGFQYCFWSTAEDLWFYGPGSTEVIDEWVAHFQNDFYQEVNGGGVRRRPLVYLFVNAIDDPLLRQYSIDAMYALRAACAAAVPPVPDPYLVAFAWSTGYYEQLLGYGYPFDAMSSYSIVDSGLPLQSYPYDDPDPGQVSLARGDRLFWDAVGQTAHKYIPTVMTGWDVRPREWNPPHAAGDWSYALTQPNFYPPTPEQLRDHLAEALWFLATHRQQCETRALLLYAWNEHDEGGWLTPTNPAWGGEGNARLERIAEVLR